MPRFPIRCHPHPVAPRAQAAARQPPPPPSECEVRSIMQG